MNKGLIFDIGFHIGQDTDFYLKKGFWVVAVDANPLLVEEGKKRFAQYITAGRLILLNVGIGQRDETLPFYVNKQLSEWSSFDKAIGTSRGEYYVIDVPLVTLRSIAIRYGVPYYIKIDIEGHDMMAIQSIRDMDDKPKYISVENGQAHMIEELFAQGYRKFKFVNQQGIQDTVLPSPAKEGQYVDHKFSFGASGPFGDEIAGEWLTKDEVLRASQAYWGNPERTESIDGWYDLHACLEGNSKDSIIDWSLWKQSIPTKSEIQSVGLTCLPPQPKERLDGLYTYSGAKDESAHGFALRHINGFMQAWRHATGETNTETDYDYQKLDELTLPVTKSLHRFDGSHVMDIGCNSGLHSLVLSKVANSVVGCDREELFINRANAAKEYLKASGIDVSNITFIKSDFVSLLSPKITAIIACRILYHVGDDHLFKLMEHIKAHVSRILIQCRPKRDIVYPPHYVSHTKAYGGMYRIHDCIMFLRDCGFKHLEMWGLDDIPSYNDENFPVIYGLK